MVRASPLVILALLSGCSRLGFEEPAGAVPAPERAPSDARVDRPRADLAQADRARADRAGDAPKPGADTLKPDTFKPDTLKADTFKPDTLKPDTFKPDTFKPDALKPDGQVPVLSWKALSVDGVSPNVAALWGSGLSTYAAGRADGVQTVFQRKGDAFISIHSTSATQALTSLHGSASGDLFAAGEDGTVVVHDNGWKSYPTGLWPGFFTVWGASASAIWAGGGNGGAYARLARIDHLLGTWTDHSSKLSKQVNAIWGSGASDVYAVGWSGSVARFDGLAWSYLATGAPATTVMNGVWGSSAKDVWIVGSNGLNAPYVLLHYDGATWAQSTPSIPLRAVCGAGSEVFVVGYKTGVYRVKALSSLYDLQAPTTSGQSGCFARSATDLYVAAGEKILHYGYH
jgi:hypothetical protein